MRILDENIGERVGTQLAQLGETIVLILPARLISLHPGCIRADFLVQPIALVLELGDAQGKDKLLKDHFSVVTQLICLFDHFTGGGCQWLELEVENLDLDKCAAPLLD